MWKTDFMHWHKDGNEKQENTCCNNFEKEIGANWTNVFGDDKLWLCCFFYLLIRVLLFISWMSAVGSLPKDTYAIASRGGRYLCKLITSTSLKKFKIALILLQYLLNKSYTTKSYSEFCTFLILFYFVLCRQLALKLLQHMLKAKQVCLCSIFLNPFWCYIQLELFKMSSSCFSSFPGRGT